jgi:phosphoribosyl-AMP cyclohydrolase
MGNGNLKDLKELLEIVDFKRGNGLVPVVVQDVSSKEVLMLAYADEEALKKTVETGYAHYYSRSRRKLWKKGETSGNVQKVKEIRVDCDGDTLLYLVEQKGNACHTGEYSCFFRKLKVEG